MTDSDLGLIVSRALPPEPWSEGDKIPWDEPAFSERMLAEHLSQQHDAASRRYDIIERQVDWIDVHLLGSMPGRVLDLGCGPGLYANRLASRGHRVHGVDFSPASIRHARAESEDVVPQPTFDLADIRSVDYGAPYDLAMSIYGELNVFTREDVRAILVRMRDALHEGSQVLIEPHTFDAVHASGTQPPKWHALDSGLFSDAPHVLLEESFWDEERATATHRWFVIDAASCAVERHADSMQAYTGEEYVALLEEEGFQAVQARPDWPSAPDQEDVLIAYTARR